jgi:hypothetical protein
MRWRNVLTGHPDVGMSIPTVIALMPDPVAMFPRERWDAFVSRRRRTNSDVDLSVGDAGGEKERAGCAEKLFLHRSFSF